MSVEASRAVWRYSKSRGTERLVLLALADEASDEGEVSAYRRSQAWLARKVNVTTVETIRKACRALESLGELETTEAGTGRSPSNYLITLPGLTRPEPATTGGGKADRAPNNQRGGPPTTGGATPQPPEGAEPNLSLAKRDPVLSHSNPLPAVPAGALALGVDAHTVESLCGHLALRVFQHRGSRGLPVVTKKWEKDMELLIRRGPLHIVDAQPVPPDRVHHAIDFVFDNLAEPDGRRNFCWADQVRSPHALRDHWAQIYEAGRKLTLSGKSRGARVLDRRDREYGTDSGGGLFSGTRLDPRPGVAGAIEARGNEQ